MLEELDEMFKSDTIKPTFEYVHIILALFLFDENPTGIGRYRIKEELSIGSGTAKSLIKKLNEKLEFISVFDKNIRKGHILTEKGKKFLEKFKKKIPFLKEGDISILKEIIIESENSRVYICQVKNSAEKLTNGIAQRDAAIKIDGKGASCIIFDGQTFTFELGHSLQEDKEQMNVNTVVQDYFKKIIKASESNLEKNDVMIIGLGKNTELARLASLNAALTLI
jgi:predicted transcriptional regulator